MKKTQSFAALFDLDGVVIDTESQYTVFWDKIGRDFLNIDGFGPKIEGQSLVKIFHDHFSALSAEEISEITRRMDELEVDLNMNYIPGVLKFLSNLKKHDIKTAIVTSSSKSKMESVYKKHPELVQYFDIILTSEDFTKGKPNPDCYLLAAQKLNMPTNACYVFEDSYSGLLAGKQARMKVVGLATTHTKDEIIDKCDFVITDFRRFSLRKLLKV